MCIKGSFGKEGWLKAGVVGKIRLSLIDYE